MGHDSPVTHTATFGGGCFWCLEAIFSDLRGVERVQSGFAGGHTVNPSYKEVCTGTTGHAEVVQISYDPAVISFEDLLTVFFATHDPTTLNRQGADVGEQYRSVIYYHTPEQQQAAEAMIAALTAAGKWAAPIVTAVEPFTAFYPAEAYHDDYFRNNPNQPYCRAVIDPKVSKFRKQFGEKLRS